MNTGSLSTVAVNQTTAVTLVGANPDRVSLLVTPPASHAVTISDQPGVAFGAGLTIFPATQALELDVHRYGSWLQKQLFAISTTGADTVGVLEGICPCHQPALPA